MCRDNPKSRTKRERATVYTERGIAYGGSDPDCSDTVTNKWHKGSGGPSGNECGLFVAHAPFTASSFGGYSDGVGTLRQAGGDLGGGSETILTVYETHPADSRVKEMGETCQTVTSRWGTGGGNVPLVQAYSIREDAKANNFSATPLEVTPALQAMQPSVQSHHAQTFIAGNMAVRRLTPRECERLQGFKDDYTVIPWKKGESPDGHRYKALGNSMAVPVMKWIGERINEINKQI